MIEAYPNLFVGDEADARTALNKTGWYIVHACKEPFHRQTLGYTGRAAPKKHPEYLIAERDGRLILNLVDAPDPAYIPKEVMDAAVDAIHQNIYKSKVLVHCNQGMSRSPTIVFLYLAKYTNVFSSNEFSLALGEFKKLYPRYLPANGVAMFSRQNWSLYVNNNE